MNARCSRTLLPLLLSTLTVLALATSASSALAQSSDSDDKGTPLEADFKGMTGVGLIGMELGFVIPAVAGAEGVWPYIVFPVVGAGAGAAGGYFLLEKGSGEPEIAVITLAAGMALFIPALVLTISETSYDPESDVAGEQRALAEAGPGLLRYTGDGRLVLAPPAVSQSASMTPREALRTGAAPVRDYQLSVVSGRF